MKSKKLIVFGALLIAIVVGGVMYLGNGSILSGKITASTPLNKADSTTADFSIDPTLTGKFTSEDTLSAYTTGGINEGAYIGVVSTGTDQAYIKYQFDTLVDLSAYKNITYWVRTDDLANKLSLVIDDDATDLVCSTGDLTSKKWVKASCSLENASTKDQIDSVSYISLVISDGTAKSGMHYDIDDISLEK
jgi:hypothetical protein